ncbi:thiamine ABC transporter substrate-binding protein [Hoyosella subflava]|uniref:ABC transporter periplasmic binding protein, thiB subfamily n=1 Tax=Hoyosella subflava (strain DSM 45089 / JCM 17490 / NBRC 109087 / DQS3-9A1) TaxID=443218 RepID=F6EPZ9_HOYSD|nr:thiamine ABC transporter substrate-binding protein [Hoyosella subflava]AEF41820.1 ABC transporter periplasmic binding protein, thiB subfamily [Hoyosella subflava DQS3-9A1]
MTSAQCNRARRRFSILSLFVLVPALSGCTVLGGGEDERGDDTVVLLTHDSFTLPAELLEQFREDSGIRIDHRAQGDAGELVTSLVLTQDNPLGDVVFGVDNTFASRAVDADVFADYEPSISVPDDLRYPNSLALTPIDYGDVCLNIDTRYFAERGIAEPETLDDLLSDEYENMTVVQNPATSSPGLAFLLATIEEYGEEGWQDYWTSLRDNGVSVADGWTQAYYVDFSGSEGAGPRPIVVSYASSPPAEAGPDGAAPTTSALAETCFRQVEYAGVLAGASNPDGAEQVIEFLLSADVQSAFPENMYVFPAVEGTPLPEAFDLYAPKPDAPITMDPAKIGANRDAWITQWRDIVLG